MNINNHNNDNDNNNNNKNDNNNNNHAPGGPALRRADLAHAPAHPPCRCPPAAAWRPITITIIMIIIINNNK